MKKDIYVNNFSFWFLIRYIIIIYLLILFFGCSTLTKSRTKSHLFNPVSYNPKNNPVVNVTSFSEAINCIDLVAGSILLKNNDFIFVFNQEFPNHTPNKKVPGSGRDMLYTVLSELGKESNRILAYDFSENITDKRKSSTIDTLDSIITKTVFGDFITKRSTLIRIDGSTTQAPTKVWRIDSGLDLALPSIFKKFFANYSSAETIEMKTIAIDMRMRFAEEGRLIPGVNSRNIISVVKTEKNWDAMAGHIKYGDISFFMELNQREDMGAGLRILIELGTIELINKVILRRYGKSAFNKCEKCLIPEERPVLMKEAKQELEILKVRRQLSRETKQKRTSYINKQKKRPKKIYEGKKRHPRKLPKPDFYRISIQLNKFFKSRASVVFDRILHSLQKNGIKDIKLEVSKNTGEKYALWNVVLIKKLSISQLQNLIMKKIEYLLESGGRDFSADEMFILKRIEAAGKKGGKNVCLNFIVR